MAEPRAERPYMPDYGVESPAWNPLPWSWAAARLAASRNFWVVTVAADGQPHALPVWGVWDDGEHRFGFSCGPRSKKARNVRANPRVVVTNEDAVECVSIQGNASVVDDRERQQHWIDAYLTKYQPMADALSADFLRQNLLVEFRPERAFAIIEREDEFAARATRWVFDS